MCNICKSWENKSLTTKEALQNLGEVIALEDEGSENMRHYLDLAGKIIDQEMPIPDYEDDGFLEFFDDEWDSDSED